MTPRWARLARLLVGSLPALLLVGCGSDDGSGATATPVEGPTQDRFEVTAEKGFAFDPAAVAVAAGPVEIVYTNNDRQFHDLRIEDVPTVFLEVDREGDVATTTVELEAGTYIYFCSIPGHREGGMEGILEVRP